MSSRYRGMYAEVRKPVKDPTEVSFPWGEKRKRRERAQVWDQTGQLCHFLIV